MVLSFVGIPIHFGQALEVGAEPTRRFSGSDITSSYNMKLKNAIKAQSVLKHPSRGLYFGDDLVVTKSTELLIFGHTYESGPPGQLTTSNDDEYSNVDIKETEVFQVTAITS